MRRLSLFAALPMLLLLLSLGAMGLRSHLVPLPTESQPPPMPPDGAWTEPDTQTEPAPSEKPEKPEKPGEEIMPEEHRLPYLLYSASDQPPLASEHYDLLYAAEPSPLPEAELILSRDALPEGGALILRKDLSARPDHGLEMRNETSYSPDLPTLAALPWPGTGKNGEIPALSFLSGASLPSDRFRSEESEPLVLIYHTHATEAFLPEDAVCVLPDESFRSSDPTQTVVALGAIVADTLNAAGIPTLHCTVMHDQASYNRAYEEARGSIKEYLARYPSIRYILDIHRDALVTVEGDHIRPVIAAPAQPPYGLSAAQASLTGELAQIMLVVGTDEGGANHPNWQTNLSLACKLQGSIAATLPGLMRPIQLRSASFLGQYAPGALLVEIGAAGNTLSQAKASAAIFGEAFARTVRLLELA